MAEFDSVLGLLRLVETCWALNHVFHICLPAYISELILMLHSFESGHYMYKVRLYSTFHSLCIL